MALVATFGLTVAKVFVSISTGSIGVLSEAIHSGLDLLSSIVTFFVVRESVRPADRDHPFGHGKIESLSALFEAFLLIVAGAYILYEGFATVASDHHVQHVGWGLAVTGGSVLINLFVYFQNRRVAREEESLAIETNAFHFLTDVFSSLAVFLSLGLLHFTGQEFWDPLVAILIAIYVFWVGVVQIKKCVAELSDTALPAEEVNVIRDVLKAHERDYLNFHELKSRKAGAARYVDFHLTMCSEQTVHQAHVVCDRIEADLESKFKETQVNIHIEPCGTHGPACETTCRFFKRPRGAAHG